MTASIKRVYLIVLLGLTGVAACRAVGAVLFAGDSRGADAAMLSAMRVGYLLVLAFAAYTALDRQWLRIFGIKVTNAASTHRSIWLRRPRCLKEQELPTGDQRRCGSCKLKIKVEVEEPLCPKCGYNLHQLTRPICPECGAALLAGEIAAAAPDPFSKPPRASDDQHQ